MRLRFLTLLVALCVASTAAAAEVRVFAAASLGDALTEIATSYERATGDRIVFNFGASSMLARQLIEGAPADIFLSADEAKMDVLQKRGLIVAASRVSVLSNSLVIVVPKRGGVRVRVARDLASVAVQRIALAETTSVPAGIYARAYLVRSGLWNAVQRKVIPTDNARSALAAAASGNVDAAIVYATDARSSNDVRIAVSIPVQDVPRISYPFALTAAASRNASARRFLAYLQGHDARRVFAKHGFLTR